MRFAHRNRPTPLELTQQRSMHERKTGANYRDFALSIKPPTDWEMDHFFDSPQPSYTSVRYEGTGESNVPKALGSHSAGRVVPRLPKPTKYTLPYQ
jgi:hypothetical protein